jgi:hypothetical protein
MYNRQILADHFNGKRAADDPEVQRDFRLLKEQAQIDWNAMYAGKDTRIDTRTTVESIEEDYIYNAQLVAKTQRTMKKVKIVAVLIVCAVAALVYALINR